MSAKDVTAPLSYQQSHPGAVLGACCPEGSPMLDLFQLDAGSGPTRRDVLVGAAAAAASAAVLAHVPAADAQVVAVAMPAPTPSRTAKPLTLTINKKELTLTLEPRVTLLDALREYANLPGTKKGCDHGQCGACTVLIDGERQLSCLTLACMHAGKDITTVEGLANGEDLHPVQQAFIDCDGFQCGYCTPGQICSAVALIKEGRAKTDDEIKEQMAGNICRCGAYPNIIAAVKQAMTVMGK